MKYSLFGIFVAALFAVGYGSIVNADFSGPPYIPSNVNITGGQINNTVIGNVTPAAGTFTNLAAYNLSLANNVIGTRTITAKNFAAQTANNYEAQNSTGTAYFKIGPDVLSGASPSDNFINVTGTLNATNSAAANGVLFTVTGAGTSAQTQTALNVNMAAGYTGSSIVQGLSINNASAGTGATYGGVAATSGYRIQNANFGARILMQGAGTAGIVAGQLINITGSSVANYGLWSTASATGGTPALNVGVVGVALSATTNVAGYFTLKNDGTSAPTLTNSALIADNGATTGDIFTARDNGTIVFSIQDSGVANHQAAKIDKLRVVTAAGAVTVSATTDYIVVVNKTVAAATTVNLPATPSTGLTFIIKDGKGDAAANNITVTPAAGNIDGAGTFVMNTNYQSTRIVYNGTEWNKI